MMINHMLRASAPVVEEIGVGGKLIVAVLRSTVGVDTWINVYDATTSVMRQQILLENTHYVSVSPSGAYLVAHRIVDGSEMRVFTFNGSTYKETHTVSTGESMMGSFSGDGTKYCALSMSRTSPYNCTVRVYKVGSTFTQIAMNNSTSVTTAHAFPNFMMPAGNYDGSMWTVGYSAAIGLRKYTLSGSTLAMTTPPSNPTASGGIFGESMLWNYDYTKFMYVPQSTASVRVYNADLTSVTSVTSPRAFTRITRAIAHPETNGWLITRDLATANIGLCFVAPDGTLTFGTTPAGSVIADIAVDPLDSKKAIILNTSGTIDRCDLGPTSVSNYVTLVSGLTVGSGATSTYYPQQLYTTNG